MKFSPVWIWAIIGVLLIIAELTTLTFILVFLGIGAVATAITTAVGLTPDINSQLALFAVISILTMLFFRKVAKRSFLGISDMMPEYAGQKIKVIKSIPAGKEGQVEYRGSPWTAYSDFSETISEGATVEIIAIDGVRVKVKPIEEHG